MSSLFEVKHVDTDCYNSLLNDFLPEKLVDIHTHVYLKKHLRRDNTELRLVSWPDKVAEENPVEDLFETYRLIFPFKKVVPLMFAFPIHLEDVDTANDYLHSCINEPDSYGLILCRPEWPGSLLEEKLKNKKFRGAKVYLNYAPDHISKNAICIFDFLPHHQLKVFNKHRMIVMLHIPRDGRLKDPDNLTQMIEIERNYPDIKLIIAHVGRAYCPQDVGNAFEILSETKNMLFDFCANTNQCVFEQLINSVGPRRILFGSDLPITRMRMKRVCESDGYVNIVPKGLYGDVSHDKNMREITGAGAESLTYFLYEQIKAFREAAITTNLSNKDIEDVFYNNAIRILQP
jgi:predicted TIM-barrel fold metal-dependent hydrolase